MSTKTPSRSWLRISIVKLYIIPMLIMGIFSSCATKRIIPSYGNFSVVGTYKESEGWKTVEVKGPSRVSNALERVGDEKGEPSISVDLFGDFSKGYPRTQKGHADSFLDGIHDVYDDDVVYEKVGSVSNEKHGEINIYHYHSDYWGNHLTAFILTDKGYAHAELWAENLENMKLGKRAFYEFVECIFLKDVK